MADLSALLLTKRAVATDSALQPGARGARKHIVTELFETKEIEAIMPTWEPPLEGKEREADKVIWAAAPAGELTPILIADNWEVAIFNEVTKQDRHRHKVGTEIYMVREGEMLIEVEGEVYDLSERSMIFVLPGSAHEVLHQEGRKFLTQLVCANCGGPADKFEA